ncbi:alpha/beta hydrolase family protein [Intrasporangium calvum]|uniref:Secreted protein n=1 Tax=Intrasporangium calvum (strain ATCC 23552 / DSM 43043 / JCM 3097 / NBRC 12989 / NCIMB 10167 / NRRL B-3866 / 7 KIP) TaxID=710696 RepID=E6SBC7_INTC7|nr:secreted protein [Intrasporangium calvum DSM 43043]
MGRVKLRQLVTRPVLIAGAAGGGSAVGAAAGSVAAAAWFARRVLTPDELQPDDVAIVAYDDESVTFASGPDPDVPGRYGVWLDGGAGHARVGQILDRDEVAGTVRRALVAVDRGSLGVGPARWNQYYYWDRPSVSLGLPDEDVVVSSDVGALPAWIVRPADPAGGENWAVLVHGRGARKEEALRAVPVLRDAGWTCLVAAYRNDRDAPRGPDGRYNLGLSEWRDVEVAISTAVARGAERIVLFGWSMGGAIVLQTLHRSRYADRIVGVCLDSAVIDWDAVLRHHGRLNHLPSPLVRVARGLMGSPRGRSLVGLIEPIDLAHTDWVARADELDVPILLIHSTGDTVVPFAPAAALAERRPDIVRFEPWHRARHCREWNYDPERWESVVSSFVTGLSPASGELDGRPSVARAAGAPRGEPATHEGAVRLDEAAELELEG